jgi:hypothetical protein
MHLTQDLNVNQAAYRCTLDAQGAGVCRFKTQSHATTVAPEQRQSERNSGFTPNVVSGKQPNVKPCLDASKHNNYKSFNQIFEKICGYGQRP